MKAIQVFDPPMCCSSGVCGAEVDNTLVHFAGSLQWLKTIGVEVERFNPLHQYDAFAANALVTQVVNEKGIECLPLIQLNGIIVSAGNYPERHELADLLGLPRPQEMKSDD